MDNKTQSYKDLEVWNLSITLTENIYKLTRSLPKEEIYTLVSQMRRAAISIPSNIAEGQGRKSRKEFSHFLNIAIGSATELETQLILVHRIYQEDTTQLIDNLITIKKMIRGLSNKLSTMY